MTDRSAMSGSERAAIFLMSLGEKEAAEVMKHMPVAEVQRLGKAMAALRSVSRNQADSVLQHFTDGVEHDAPITNGSPGFLKRVLTSSLGEDKAGKLIDRIVDDEPRGLDSLQLMEAKEIAEIVHREHPQVIAVVLPVSTRRNRRRSSATAGEAVDGSGDAHRLWTDSPAPSPSWTKPCSSASRRPAASGLAWAECPARRDPQHSQQGDRARDHRVLTQQTCRCARKSRTTCSCSTTSSGSTTAVSRRGPRNHARCAGRRAPGAETALRDKIFSNMSSGRARSCSPISRRRVGAARRRRNGPEGNRGHRAAAVRRRHHHARNRRR